MQISYQLATNPVARALDILGDRWSILIIREAFLRRHRFEEFRQCTGASRGTLSKRLSSLVGHGVLYKNPYQSNPTRYEYRLTDKGLGLYPWALLVWQWEAEWADLSTAGIPRELTHNHKGEHPLNAQAVCRHCRELLSSSDVTRVASENVPNKASKSLKLLGSQRRTRLAGSRGQFLEHIIDILGDRWTLLLLAAAFVGVKRYDDFRKQLGVATNILADRLRLLVENDVFSREEYQSNPPRHQYFLTAKGKSLYPQTMAMRQWALDWLPEAPHTLALIHKQCGESLATDVVCKQCGDVPTSTEVLFTEV